MRLWHDAGLLQPGRMFTLSLGECIAIATTEWKRVTITGAIAETLCIVDTPCQYGGTPRCALCRCGRRAAALFVHDGGLVCRRCADLPIAVSGRAPPSEQCDEREQFAFDSTGTAIR